MEIGENRCAPSSRRRVGAQTIGALAIALGALFVAPACAANDPTAATSDREAMEEARQEIPWNKLSLQDQRMTQYVVRKASLFRRAPTHVFDCDPQVFNFLSQHPEVVVNVWNLMGVSKLSLQRTSPVTFRAADQAGTEGALRILHSQYEPNASNKLLVFAEGNYQAGPMPEPIRAHCVLLLRSASRKESNGRTYVTARLDSFLRFEKTGVDLVAKTLRPLLVKAADNNFTETMKFVSTFSRTAEQRPDGIVNLADRLENVDAETRVELATICQQVAARQTASTTGDTGIRLVRLQSPVEDAEEKLQVESR
jgi:hypothetical protein